MIKVLFVCHGNICRSPMGEFVLKDMVRRLGVAGAFQIASAATSTEELGNPVYPPARRKLSQYGIDCRGHSARQVTRADYDRYDYIFGMDSRNVTNMLRIFGGDPIGKVRRFLDMTERPGDVADPWYTDDFDATYEDVLLGCRIFLQDLGFNVDAL